MMMQKTKIKKSTAPKAAAQFCCEFRHEARAFNKGSTLRDQEIKGREDQSRKQQDWRGLGEGAAP